MATLCLPPQTSIAFDHSGPRKRTSSFSFPQPSAPSHSDYMGTRPTKAPRLSIRKTTSFLDMSDCEDPFAATTSASSRCWESSAHERPSRTRKRSNAFRQCTLSPQATSNNLPTLPTSPGSPRATISPTSGPAAVPRFTSPLAPVQTSLLERPQFPRSKPRTDLHRKAVTTCMLRSPEGQRFLHMGPRLAFSIASATKELERIVAASLEQDGDQDTIMADASTASPHSTSGRSPSLSNSWVVLPGAESHLSTDWEMISCN